MNDDENDLEVNSENNYYSEFANLYQMNVIWFHPSKEWFREFLKDHFMMVSDDETEEIKKVIDQEEGVRQKEYLKNKIKQIKDTITEDLIKKLIDKAKPNLSSSQKIDLKIKTKNALIKFEDKYDYEELKAFVELVIEGKNVEEVRKDATWKKVVSYVWTCIVGVVTILVILAIFDSTYDDNQKIIYAILILIYLSLQGNSMSFGYLFVNHSNALYEEFKRIRSLLNNEPTEQENRKRQEEKEVINKAMVKSIINGVFLFIAYIITLFTLFGSL